MQYRHIDNAELYNKPKSLHCIHSWWKLIDKSVCKEYLKGEALINAKAAVCLHGISIASCNAGNCFLLIRHVIGTQPSLDVLQQLV